MKRFKIKYQIKDAHNRETVDLFDYSEEIIGEIMKFPNVKFVGMTSKSYTIEVYGKDKNRIVRKLGRKIARTSLKEYVKYCNSHKRELFIAVKEKKKK